MADTALCQADAWECLTRADEIRASVKEMRARWKMSTGEDSEPPNDHFEGNGEDRLRGRNSDDDQQADAQVEGFEEAGKHGSVPAFSTNPKPEGLMLRHRST